MPLCHFLLKVIVIAIMLIYKEFFFKGYSVLYRGEELIHGD